MTEPNARLAALILSKENERLEFKEAKNSFSFEKLVKYCAALSNEGGGSIILGVTDKRPRRVVGTNAFRNIEKTKADLLRDLHHRVDVEEVVHADGRVLIFTSPGHPVGAPLAVDGAYWMRAGEDLVPMTPDMLKRLLDESGPDYSAGICPAAAIGDLDPGAIEALRMRWHAKSGNAGILTVSIDQLLQDAELVIDGGVTYAALILLGKHSSLGRLLPHAEVIFEYRSSEVPGPASQREEFREGFLLYYDRIWELVNLRNDRQHYQDGLFMIDIPTFNEGAVRESILNAVSHRDYRHGGSVFVRQFPRRVEMVSPGGFPEGITPANILDRQLPRNRRVADVLAKCGLVERAGQGANRIYESCIREGKSLPDFAHTDAFQVSLTLHGQLRDSRFVKFLERVGKETGLSFDVHELLVLDLIHREQRTPRELQARLAGLLEAGVIERVGRGRGVTYLLSRRFHSAIGERGAYTRKKGLDRKENKALLLRHVRESGDDGCPMSELQQVLPSRSRAQIKRLMEELRSEGLVELIGERRGAKWFALKER